MHISSLCSKSFTSLTLVRDELGGVSMMTEDASSLLEEDSDEWDETESCDRERTVDTERCLRRGVFFVVFRGGLVTIEGISGVEATGMTALGVFVALEPLEAVVALLVVLGLDIAWGPVVAVVLARVDIVFVRDGWNLDV